MKGLLRDNFYAALSGARAFAAIMTFAGIFAAVMDNRIPSLIIGYMLSVMVGFSINSAACAGRESSVKWSQYRLAAPVRRADIVRSLFLSQMMWLLVGTAFAGACAALSVGLHGWPFDKETDVFMLFVVGASVSLFMSAIFFPLFFLGGEERKEVLLMISLFGGIGMVMGLTTLINGFFPAGMTASQIVVSGMAMLLCGIALFCLCCPFTVFLFRKKEY